MRISNCVGCKTFPCADVNSDVYNIPNVDIEAEDVSIILISEAAPADPDDYYYGKGDPSFQRTTVQAFSDAGADVTSMEDIVNLGVYCTSAVKCGKTGYGIKAKTIKECSFLLEQEISHFPNVKAYLLMGDVAIKAINYIAIRAEGARAIPAGSTYKIRGEEYYFQGSRTFPSYLQAGPSFGIEKSKKRMIAEDIAAALSILE